jgi:phosphoesterase RecJ-like protein
MGSQLGMRAWLISRGKSVRILNPSSTPPRYRFLDPDGTIFEQITPETQTPKVDAVIVLDTGTWSQLPGMKLIIQGSGARVIVIDHHRTQDHLGDLELVDVTAPACGMLVYRMFQALGGPIDSATASALFVAIATDTGWMHHSNTTPEVFSVLARLTELGAEPAKLYQQIYESNTLPRMRLLGTLCQKIELHCNGKFAVASITQADIAAANAHPMDTEDFIVYLMSLAGVEVAAFFIEQMGRESTKVSFRSRTSLDCSRLAEQFGGGGHHQAAGATMPEGLSAAVHRVVPAVEKALAPCGVIR